MNYVSKKEMGKKLINDLCLRNLTSYETYLKSVKRILHIKTNIPIYISSKLIFFPICSIRNYECLWINYRNIKVIYNDDEKTIVIFANGERIIVNIRIGKMIKLIENVHKIISYKENVNFIMENNR